MLYIKRCWILCLTLGVCFFGCISCQKSEKSSDEILSELMILCGELPAGEIYRSGSLEGEEGFFSSALKSALFGEEAEALLSRCDYAMYLSSFAEPYEIAVFQAESRTDARLLETMCLNRSDELRVALRQTEFEPMGAEIRIVHEGTWVVLGVTHDGDGFAREAKKLLR